MNTVSISRFVVCISAKCSCTELIDIEKEAEKFVQESKTLGKNYQVLVSGKVIAQALDNSGKSIGELLLHAESVVVYRSSPL